MADSESAILSHAHALGEADLDDIADSTNGYVAADLAALANEAALCALQRSAAAAADEEGSDAHLHITVEDVQAARAYVQPSALRELQVDIPRTEWGDVAGAQEAKQVLQETVQWPLQHPELFLRAGVSPPVGVLLYGPPGTGKTLLAKALAHETRANFISIKGPELFSMYVGDSEKAVQRLFRQAASVAPCVVFLDEVDAMGRQRGTGAAGGSNVNDRVLNQLLQELDTLQHAFTDTVAAGGDAAAWLANRVVVVAASNRPDTLDAALVRPGRLEQLVYVGLPDAAARESLLAHALHKAAPDALDGDINLSAVAAVLVRASGAECAGVVRRACLEALQRDMHHAVLTQADLMVAAQGSVPQCTPELLQWYGQWKQG
jgi:AAA family ATPase